MVIDIPMHFPFFLFSVGIGVLKMLKRPNFRPFGYFADYDITDIIKAFYLMSTINRIFVRAIALSFLILKLKTLKFAG